MKSVDLAGTPCADYWFSQDGALIS